VKFTFEKSFCVALGTFNIYVIQPSLLTEMGVVEGKVGGFSSDFTQPGWRFHADGARWIVRPERIAVESSDPSFDCGRRILSMLEHLRWTPVVAVGTNVVFRSDISGEAELPASFRLPVGDQRSMCRRQFQGVIKREDERELHLQLDADDECLRLLLNTHIDLPRTIEGERRSQSELNKLACSACNRFMQDRIDSVGVAQALLGGEYQWDRPV
jgi:hypothetical protein